MRERISIPRYIWLPALRAKLDQIDGLFKALEPRVPPRRKGRKARA